MIQNNLTGSVYKIFLRTRIQNKQGSITGVNYFLSRAAYLAQIPTGARARPDAYFEGGY